MSTDWHPDSLRASHDDREAVIRRLNDAFSEGRLDMSELEERVSAAYASTTLGDLRGLTSDLPSNEPPTVAYPPQVPYQPGYAPYSYVPPPGPPAKGPIGTPRSPVVGILLWFVTLGIYTFVWAFKTGREIRQHSGIGLGGATFAFLFIPYVGWIITMIVIGSDVKDMLLRSGQQSRVGGVTACWALLPVLGLFVWYVRMQNQLNDYWRAEAASRTAGTGSVTASS